MAVFKAVGKETLISRVATFLGATVSSVVYSAQAGGPGANNVVARYSTGDFLIIVNGQASAMLAANLLAAHPSAVDVGDFGVTYLKEVL